MVEIGNPIVFTDQYGNSHNAVVTQVWSAPVGSDFPSLNVVYVSDDSSETDQYGRQIKRSTSVPHESSQGAGGMKWKEAVTAVELHS